MITIADIGDNEKVINDEELEIFFNKYDVNELEMFSNIFEYVHNKELLEAQEVAKNVYYEKRKNMNDDYETSKYDDYNLLKISYKNDLLNDEELAFLQAIVEDASFYLSTIRDYDYENIIEDFSEDDYNIDQMLRLEESIEKETSKRKVYTKDKITMNSQKR